MTVGQWSAPAGVDLYVEASKLHGSNMVVDVNSHRAGRDRETGRQALSHAVFD